MIEMLGYAASVAIGLSLGLIGGGGSILTVPVLVYLMGISPVAGTAYSLFIVGSTSLVGSVRYARKGMIDLRTAVLFGIISFLAVFLTRHYAVPAIPATLFTVGHVLVSKNLLIMLFFAVVMLFSARSMIRAGKADAAPTEEETPTQALVPLALKALLVGIVTGLVGAGGGFLIVPALVILARLPMKLAVGTSLSIIAVNSLLGFLGDLSHFAVNWHFLLIFTSLAIAGIFIGSALAERIDGQRLKTGFGWFVLLMGTGILAKELFF
ncbi:hypothetical protein SAMN05421823_102401 [Catalinimonas alkaloidigena]|uniref:Probable membrane transporter protein n=1 Tax=Catalinimonas alkaloidigena TaxID=1075417 RepID=A0A1G9ASZ4_9BACT|nr:sulfite exporter TauE/SafE family protein [Catalinimonas alkaloidigena]SDK30381.1 hypothetical protein SAMN05421823_102401 [Catalinimonas alkaloidigena]